MPPPAAPQPLNEQVRRRLSVQPRRDSAAERRLRSALHALGLRFFVERSPHPALGRRRADIVFPRARVAVYLHGCFWHGCDEHGTLPRNNRDWWASKIRRNQERDRETARTLTEVGWRVVEVWEHEDAVEAAARIAVVLRGGEPSVRGVTERLASSAPSANTSRIGAPRA